MFWLLLKTHMWLLIIGECWINSDVDPWIWQRRGRMGKELQGNITSGSCKKSFQEDLFWLIIYFYCFIWPPNTEIQMIVPKQQQKNPPSNKKLPNHNVAICVINVNIFFLKHMFYNSMKKEKKRDQQRTNHENIRNNRDERKIENSEIYT